MTPLPIANLANCTVEALVLLSAGMNVVLTSLISRRTQLTSCTLIYSDGSYLLLARARRTCAVLD